MEQKGQIFNFHNERLLNNVRILKNILQTKASKINKMNVHNTKNSNMGVSGFNDVLKSQTVSEVKVTEVVEDKREPQMVFDPSHPDANPDGYVAMPNINLMEEMVDMLSATRAYEANVTAIHNTKSMAQKALDIGGR